VDAGFASDGSKLVIAPKLGVSRLVATKLVVSRPLPQDLAALEARY
jgi:hypothetical protein